MQKVVQLLRFRRTSILFIFTLFFSFQLKSQDFQDGKVSLDLKNASLKEALTEIQQQSGVRFIYDQDINKYASLKITHAEKDMPVKKAIERVLRGTNLQYVWEDGHVMISEKLVNKQPSPNAVAGQGSGGLKGRIVEFETSQPLPGATVRIMELGRGVTADDGGYYRFTGIPAGKYTLQASFVSYTKESQSIEVRPGRE